MQTNKSHYRLRLRIGHIISACFGFLLIFVAPYGHGYFKDWLIPLTSSYRINLFEAFAIPIIYGGLIYYGPKIRKSEQFLFLSIILVIFSRIVSTLAAENVQIVQYISIFRYIETLVLIYICANLFSNQKNRHFFIMGIIIGVAIETVGGIFVHLKTQYRGIFVSNSSFILQTFLIIACILAFINRKGKFRMTVFILAMVLAILGTLTRTAWIFLITSVLILALVYSKKRILKNILLFIVSTGIVVLLIGKRLPVSTEIFVSKTKSAFSGSGTVLYRFYLWDMSIASFLQHPIFGIGSGSFARQQENLPQVFNVELPEYYRNLNLQLSTHSTFLGVLSETGIVGLVAYLFWIIAIMGIFRKIFRLSNVYLSHDRYVIAASLIIISLIIFDTITQCSFTPMSSTFIGFALGCLREKSKISRTSELMK